MKRATEREREVNKNGDSVNSLCLVDSRLVDFNQLKPLDWSFHCSV